MPKGRVESREVTCRGCGQQFVSDRPGKASWFCDTCKAERGKKSYVRVGERDPEAAAKARADREAEAERRRAEREAEAERRRAAREAEAARVRAAKEAERRAVVEQRLADQRAAEVARVRAALEQAEAEQEAKAQRVRELRDELAQLQPTRPPRRARLGRVAEPEPIVEPARELTVDAAGELGQILAHVRRSMIRRALDGQPVGKVALRRAITHLTQAAGIPDTRRELRRLAIEALVWEFRLSGRDRDPGTMTDDALADAA